jgi:hypothetical protein
METIRNDKKIEIKRIKRYDNKFIYIAYLYEFKDYKKFKDNLLKNNILISKIIKES